MTNLQMKHMSMCLQILNSEIQFANPQMQIMIRFTNKSKLHLNTYDLRR